MAERQLKDEPLAVFVSYSRDDQAFVDQLVATLEVAGFKPKIDRVGIYGAEAWQERLTTLIRESDTIVFVLSPSSAKSEMCAWEVEQAVAMGKRIIPIICRSLNENAAPKPLARLNFIYFYNEPNWLGSSWATGLRQLDQALKADLGWQREHTRLFKRADEWQAGGKMPDRLLRGEDIRAARQWEARRPHDAQTLTDLHQAFISASETFEASEREQELATALAAAEREALWQRKIARRTSVGLIFAFLLAIFASWSSWSAWRLNKLAVSERERAEAQTRQAVSERERAETQSKKAAEAVEVVVLLTTRIGQRRGLELVSIAEADQLLYRRLERLAAGGNLVAMRLVGRMLDEGRGVVRNHRKSEDWYAKAANSGDDIAMTYLAFSLLFDESAPEEDRKRKAQEWLEKAAAAGNADAILSLSLSFRSRERLPEFLDEAARKGGASIMRNIGDYFYLSGEPIRDLDQARKWYERAVAAGDPDAEDRLPWLRVEEAAQTGKPEEALRLSKLHTNKIEASEIDQVGQPGRETATALGTFAWIALLAKAPDDALQAVNRALTIAPDNFLNESYRAHCLMYLGRTAEARELYLSHTDKTINGERWPEVIAWQFAELRKAGRTHPSMIEIEVALSKVKK